MAQIRMMVSAETRRRLRWHAGLDEIGEATTPSISACTWAANDLEDHFDPAVWDFIATLERLNHELNSEIPSESTGPDSDIPGEVAYAVAEVSRQLREYAETKDPSYQLSIGRRYLWLIETAWLAVLAGDIDDIAAHVREEEAAQ